MHGNDAAQLKKYSVNIFENVDLNFVFETIIIIKFKKLGE